MFVTVDSDEARKPPLAILPSVTKQYALVSFYSKKLLLKKIAHLKTSYEASSGDKSYRLPFLESGASRPLS